jgi:uncharacterized protein YodC (DUF2158 family)
MNYSDKVNFMNEKTVLKTGDVVYLKSDKYVKMSIGNLVIYDDNDENKSVAICNWFDNYTIKEYKFYVDQLVLVEENK